MTKEHIDAVLAFTKRKWERGVSREYAIRRLQTIGFLDESGEIAARFQHLGEWPPLNTPLQSQLNEEGEM
ncbi:hypothetical protein [Chitinophaga ginsengisoli]|uniref:Uncharacterized protein n=1 Tax=Chitinophaga ginsengisoli TaxID=363837 RepID=A0A2P8G6T2_9BACT|nr:hypothetical protein [Chitinophaga ginsengisoli]PSL29693.1 hypothetical protein CLV42_10620 [Chitinophaga ginsengisoli]